MNAGPEICVLSTKTYTSQLALLILLAYATIDKYEEGKKELNYAWNLSYNLTSRNMRNHIEELANKLKNKDHIFTIGRDLQYPTAMEAALKIKEVSYIHAEGFAGGELKHGTIALIEKGTPCIVFVSKNIEKDILRTNLAQRLLAEGVRLTASVAKEIDEFIDDDVCQLLKQTQQDTLQWCLDELKEMDWYSVPSNYDDGDSFFCWKEDFDKVLSTIKKKMEKLK